MSILGKFVSNLPCCVSSSQSWEMVSVERELTLLLQVPGTVVRTSWGHHSRAVFHQSWHTYCRRSIWLSARWVIMFKLMWQVKWGDDTFTGWEAYLAAVCSEACKTASVSAVWRLFVPPSSGSDVMNDTAILSVCLLCCSFGCENMWYINTAGGCVVHHINFNINWHSTWLIA